MNNKGQPQQHKKLGLMSCIVVVVGGCVGAGIFFKNAQILAFSQHKIILAILCWLIGGIGVLCMGLSLIEVVTGCKKPSNLGMGAWCKTYNNNFIYKMCKNFIAYLYCPIILVALAYYFVQALFSAIGPLANG
jgi:amino acid transporter